MKKTSINYAINNNIKIKAYSHSNVKLNIETLKVTMSFLIVFLCAIYNIKTYANLYSKARHNYVLQLELEKLQKENSVLEGKKSNLINIKEIELKAENLGFVYNNSINYLK